MGECICLLSWRVHHNFVRDGRYSERGWACTPTPSTALDNFSVMVERQESGRCHSVYSVFYLLYLLEFILYARVYAMFTITQNNLLQDTVV
jgi:hypothetical protein